MSKKFSVKSYRKEYWVEFKDQIQDVITEFSGENYWFVIDQNIAELYQSYLEDIISSNSCILITAEENSKSYEGVITIIQRLIEEGFKRNNTLVAIGGGITQDVTAFISSILYRGVDWVFVPTNLLSQCDSCIGSKTSINFKNYKNQIGGFHPPKKIFICQKFLDTLDSKDIYSGLGEMAHYFLIDGRDSFEFFKGRIDESIESRKHLGSLIDSSLKIKRQMIEIDEFDEGPRNVFNYGHSFGHAIEGYTNYAIPHGIAVSFGMDIANAVSVEYGFMQKNERFEMREVLSKIWNETTFPQIEIEKYISFLSRDKKNVESDLKLVLSKGLGKMFLQRMKKEEKLKRVIKDCLTDYQKGI